MNERIRELERQAIEYANQQNTFDPRSEFNKKFAELIVKECATFIDSHEQIDKYGEAQDMVYGKDLLEHFGVEE